MSKAEETKKKIVTLVNEAVNMKEQVAIYCDMMQRISLEGKITPVIRFAYENFYGMKQAGLPQNWRDRYFEKANEYLRNINKSILSFDNLMDEIGVCDEKSIQPVFASKLLHTLNNNEPIYDSRVRNFLETGDPNGGNLEKRKKSAIKIYKERIKSFYCAGNHSALKELMLHTFNENYAPVDSHYIISDTKKIDFIIWALGKRHKISEFDY